MPASNEPWTIERIRDVLGDPDLVKRFLAEINRTPADELLAVFARWERIAENTVAAVERAQALAPYDERGEEAPGEWTDRTERVLAEAKRLRASRGAA